MAVQAASKTNDTAGDGTTTATILSAAIIAEGMKIVAAGTNPVQLSRGIESTVSALVKDLKQMSTDVTDADLANVATVSAGGNETVCCTAQLPHSAVVAAISKFPADFAPMQQCHQRKMQRCGKQSFTLKLVQSLTYKT